jgi:hypothetical protein
MKRQRSGSVGIGDATFGEIGFKFGRLTIHGDSGFPANDEGECQFVVSSSWTREGFRQSARQSLSSGVV